MVFGDLFLADVRSYREGALADTGIEPLFPLWGRHTGELATEMIEQGVRATLTCVDPRQLPASFAGRTFDHELLADLPDHVDPCGENGEFHTFVSDGPGFVAPLDVRLGEVVERDGFVFADVLPVLR
jgi:diphthamide synthase (EF-2-diphthine--ammonia ligase)